MTRDPCSHVALTIGVLAIAACSENTTEPETTRPLPSTAPVPAVVSNSWITRKDMPRARVWHATAAVTDAAGQSILYVIAGMTNAGGISGTVQAYNVATNRWTTKAPLPLRVFRPNGAGVINGKIYISGGVGIRRIARSSLFMYDPATDTWTPKASMPSPGFSGVTGVINHQLYALTGCAGFGADCDPYVPFAFYRYDPVADQWASLPTPPSAHIGAMAGVIGGKFYVAGGVQAGLPDGGNQLDVYDPATNQWTTKAPLPRARWAGAGVALRAKLYVIGGVARLPDGNPDGTETVVRTTSVYDPSTDTWTHVAPMPFALANLVGSRVVLNGQPRIEVIVGNTNLQYIP
jgi:N-acetylneuraminic acid mutarotase